MSAAERGSGRFRHAGTVLCENQVRFYVNVHWPKRLPGQNAQAIDFLEFSKKEGYKLGQMVWPKKLPEVSLGLKAFPK